ncbi:hypothetical protein NEMIN01_2038 [Nematocida minor]|uniref:uncharacterized protein n=1 Tax=Nematocida minor TaxID=1912983 RepID=UPI00221F7C37|nr:uncharacterized protein NEMIN01_2038 [Nematocida minor]KAI5192474.1 hypothetical protein NEMIN01_2038 [Nematocida minor]
MKNSKEIDQYFKMDEQALGEMEERRPSVRRVSFALEPQIAYSQVKDEPSKSESSSISMSMEMAHKTSMEMTLDDQLLDEELMQNETLPLCEEKEENFIMDDSEDTMEERRMSICPINREKTMEHTVCHVNTEVANANSNSAENTPSVISNVASDKDASSIIEEDPIVSNGAGIGNATASNLETGSASQNENIAVPSINENVLNSPRELDGFYDNVEEYSLDGAKDDILSDMLSEIVCAADSNTLVYDTVNVEEVLSKYETVKKEETKKIREILAETGIRFLDNLSLSNRRETLSKIRNKVENGDVIYYKDFVQRRIEMQNMLSAGLSAEIEKTRDETEIIEREVDCTGLSSIDRNTLLSKLRQMKSDARKEGKAHWHKKRLEVEKEFLKKTEDLYADYEKEKQQLSEKIRKMKKETESINIKELEAKEKAMKEILVTVGTLSQEEVGRFVEEVEKKKEVEKALEAQYSELLKDAHEVKKKDAETTQIIETEKAEIQSLQDGLHVAEVQKDDLEQIKSAVQRMEVILGVKILEISHSRLLMSICDIVITVIYDGATIVDVYAETKAKSLFKEFISLSVGSVLVSMGLLVESMPVVIRYILEMASIEKEVKKLGVSVPYEIHHTEKEMSIQFMIRKGKSGQMGQVVAIFKSGSVVPEISSNIKGFQVSRSRYGSISESVDQARNIAHIK